MQGDSAVIEWVARDNLARVLDSEIVPEDIGLDLDMVRDYGLTSLNKVLFMTSVCDETGVSVSHFTEQDVARLRTLRDVVTALTRYAGLATHLAGRGYTP
jgi:acyl carrier protein